MTSLTADLRAELRHAVDQARRAQIAAEKGRRFVGYNGPHGLRGYKALCRCPVCTRAKCAYQRDYRARRGR